MFSARLVCSVPCLTPPRSTQGGNDHEIFEDSRTIGHSVTSFRDTMAKCRELFF